MIQGRFLILLSLTAALCVCVSPAPSFGETPVETLIPSPFCAEGWHLDGKVQVYTRDTLYDYINGEAELFYPYGFSSLASGFYRRKADGAALVADVYRMGSSLDAFGIYAHYRGRDASVAPVGAGGFLTESQLMSYQDRYFVRISVSGDVLPGSDAFLSCAKAISARLPADVSEPRELALIRLPSVVPQTERYIAESLLGYRFFRKGLIARVLINEAPRRVFVVFGGSPDGAANALEEYLRYLKEAQAVHSIEGDDSSGVLKANDPLYKGILVRKTGSYLIGVADLDDPSRGVPIIEAIMSQLSTL